MANLKDTFVLGKLTVTDSIIADKFKGPLEGNAATATKFNTSRTFSFAGDVSGTVTTDCASGFEVSLSVANNSHSHTYTNITDLDTPLTNYLNQAKKYTNDQIAALVDASPDLLNTLNELAAAINDDPNFATTVANNIATKVAKTGDTMSGTLHAHGGITLNSSTAEANTPLYILGIKAFAEGGNVTWSARANVSVGHADAATNATTAGATFTNSIGTSSDTHASALKTYFDNNKSTIVRNKLLSFYSSAYGNGSQCMGYFLNGYDSTPYGGFFVAHYNAPRYVGIQNGSYTEWELSKVGHNHNDLYLQLTGGTMSGGLTVNGKATFVGGVDIRGNASDKPLVVRSIVGSDGSGTVDALYLQYGANKPVYFGNTGSYTISANGANYSGNAATASALTGITTSDNASPSDVKRRIWFAYSDNTTGRPAYDDRFTIQTSTGTLFAPIFSGDLSGTATKALQDSDGLSIKDTYLKLSGGTMTGGLTVNGSTLLKSTLTIGSSAQNVSPKVGIHVHDLRELGRGQSGDEPAPWPGLFGDQSVNFYFDEINDSYGGGTAANRWMSIMHMKGWKDSTYAAWELAGNAHSDSQQDTLRYRQGRNNSWGAWQSVLTDANFTTYLDSTYVNVTGDTMTGTLTLTSPANSSEGGQLVLAHTQNSNTQNGIVIDTANSDFRVFGNPSKTGTASSNYGSILTYSPYDLKLSICSMGSGNGHFKYNTSDKCIDVLFT